MKKALRFLSVILCLAILCALISCKDSGETQSDNGKDNASVTDFMPQTADELWSKIDETMNETGSYKMEQSMIMTGYLMGYKYDATAKGLGYYHKNGDDRYVYASSEMEIVCQQASLNEKMDMMHAYCDGKMYVYANSSNGVQKLCSKASYADYEKAYEESAFDEIDFTDCTTKDFVKNDNGSWELKLLGFTKKTINTFVDGLDMGDDFFGADVLDMSVTVTADSQFRAESLNLKVIFDVEADSSVLPKLVLDAKYSGFNATEPNKSDIKADEFKEVDDLYILNVVADSLVAVEEAKFAKVVNEINVKVSCDGQTSTDYEKDTIRFGKENGAFYYDIDAEMPDINVKVSYRNGKQTVIQGSDSESVAQTEDEAAAFISQQLGLTWMDEYQISDIKKLGDGVYKFISDNPDVSEFNSYFQQVGAKVESASQEVTVTLNGDKIVKMESELKMNAKLKVGNRQEPMTIIRTVTTNIEEVSESSVAL